MVPAVWHFSSRGCSSVFVSLWYFRGPELGPLFQCAALIALLRRQDQPARSGIGRVLPPPIARDTWRRRSRERSRRAIDRPRARGPAPIARVGTCSFRRKGQGIFRCIPPEKRNGPGEPTRAVQSSRWRNQECAPWGCYPGEDEPKPTPQSSSVQFVFEHRLGQWRVNCCNQLGPWAEVSPRCSTCLARSRHSWAIFSHRSL